MEQIYSFAYDQQFLRYRMMRIKAKNLQIYGSSATYLINMENWGWESGHVPVTVHVANDF